MFGKVIKGMTILVLLLLVFGALFIASNLKKEARTVKDIKVEKFSKNTENQSSTSANTTKVTDQAATPEASTEKVTEHQEATEITTSSASKAEGPSSLANKIVRLNATPQVQKTATTCAPTTVSMLLSYKGITASQELLAKEMGTDTSFGTHNVDAIRVLNQHLFGYESPARGQAGYRLETVTNPATDKALFIERLKKTIDEDFPMYYTLELSTLYPNIKGEHNVLGVGYQMNDQGTDIEYVYYLDPASSMQDPVYGGLKKITVDELLYSTSVCVEPNYAW